MNLGALFESVSLNDVFVSWSSDVSEPVWTRALALGDLDKDVSAESIFIGPALSNKNLETLAYLNIVKEGEEGKKELRWGIMVYERPKSSPPPDIVEASKRCDGLEGLAAFLNEFLPHLTPTPIGSYVGHLMLREKDWKCKLVPRALGPEDGAAAQIGAKAIVEDVGYRFEEGVSGISEVGITFDHEDGEFRVHMRCRAPIELGVNFSLPQFSKAGQLIVDHLFDRST